jgi:hypothetical protein
MHMLVASHHSTDSTMSRRIEDAETDGVFHGNVEANYYMTF